MTWKQDLRFALRLLFRSPLFTVVAVLTLALGIGASCAIYSVVQTLLLRAFPFPDPTALTYVWETNSNGEKTRVSPANYLDWRQQNTVFERLAAFEIIDFSVTGGPEPEI